MKRLFLLISIIVFGHSVALYTEAQATGPHFTLEKRWETAKVLAVPESVIYDEAADILYVSNINGKSTEKNGEGFISRVTITGEVAELKWITGLNAPKGSGIHKGKLYVADIDRLVEIDIAKGTITNFYQAAGAEFLNDVAIGEGGSVYVSDMSPTNSVLYRLSDGKISPWLRGSEISRPNGLFMERDRLIVGNSGDGTLKALTLPDKTIESLAVTGAGIDGIASDGEGNYFISDWAGKTSVVKPSGDVVELLDTTSSHINSADITYIKEKNLLIIPTFFDNRIMAYEVLKK